MIDLVLHNETKNRAYGEKFFRRICDAAAPYLGTPSGHTAQVGIILISSSRMKILNRKHRHKDTSTDVLSFALSSDTIPGYTDISLGDIFISPSDVAVKATGTQKSNREQMTWTVVHGLLHLAGYDHEKNEAAAKKMFALEQKILKKCLNLISSQE